ncbi:MAG: DUF3237 domain-containing protein [Alphaproteobacteria bacterium]|nr:DUF3237 domain-containing protein [Alphaproteobacteria bacterium]
MIETRHLFTLTLEVPRIQDLGQTPMGARKIAQVTGGRFEGERLSGTVHAGPGGDWLLLRQDGVLALDVRITLETNDGHLIYMTYQGLRHGPKEVMDRLNRGEKVDPASYYFRMVPQFETSSEKYAWLNRMVAVAKGQRESSGPIYTVFEVL